MIELLTMLWVFASAQPAMSKLTADAARAEFAAPAGATNGFTVKMTVDLKKFAGQRTILEISNVLTVTLRQHDSGDRNRQNYPAFKMRDGTTPVLEATLKMESKEHPDWREMTIGIPLGMLRKPEGAHEVVLNFSGARWTMYVDGELLDNDFPFGYPRWPERGEWRMDGEFVRSAELHAPAVAPIAKRGAKKRVAAQYWTPPGHNAWVGDVATLFHDGRYHVFYLYDRRHHASKFGQGAHYFEHLSTRDFKTWTEHEAAAPIDEQWECIGTGTPFVWDGKLHLSYGLHTTRVVAREATTLPAQWDYLKKNGRSGNFARATTAGFPAGSTYSVSADGKRFEKSHVMFHPCENPSVYIDPQGKLRMLANYAAKGTWESEALDGGWRSINAEFPPGGDCTFFFRWGQFDYIVGGFTGMWSKGAEAAETAYEDVVRKGLDFYDGLSVPSIAEVKGGRFLMAGWIPIGGWGGPLIVRELLQLEDGRIGSRWMKEMMPKTGRARRVEDTANFETAGGSFLLTFEVEPRAGEKGRVGISLLGSGAGCEVQIDDSRAQFAAAKEEGFAGRQKSLREGGAPHQVGDYAIENLIGVEKPFTVRILVKSDEKLGGSIVDAEIAGKRTMVSYRAGLVVRKVAFRAEGVGVKNVKVAALE